MFMRRSSIHSTVRLLSWLFLAFVVTGLHPVLSQSIYGTLLGTVTDTTAAVVPGATVTMVNAATQETRTTVSDQLGNYVFNNVRPGEYAVEAQLPGFKKARHAGIRVEVDSKANVGLTLEVGETTEVVDVVGSAPVLNTQSSSLGQVVDQREMVTLPLAGGGGRSFFSLMLLTTGVTSQPGEGYALDNMRINGGRPRADDYLLDGTSIQQIVFGGPSINPAVDSIQEFKVETNSYPAEYGRISGGIINAITRSGGNAYHGSVYEFLRNDVLDARNFFLPRTAKKDYLRQNEFGFTFGGPILRDRVFFFGDYQGFRRRKGVVFTGISVPSAAFKRGDFSSLLGPQIGVDPCGRPVLKGAIYDPQTRRVAAPGDPNCPGGSGGSVVLDPSPSNLIGQGRISKAAAAFLPLWPDPLSGASFSRTAPNANDIDRFDIRGDYNATQKDKFFVVFHYQDALATPAQPLLDERASAEKFTNDPAKAGTVAWNHGFSSSMINEFRFGFTRRNPSRVPGGYGTTSPSDFGISGFPTCNLPDSGGKCGTPIVNVLGFQQISGGTMLFEPAQILQFADSVSKIVGRHNLKFGTDVRRFRIDNIQPNNANGNFAFNFAETALPGTPNTGFAFASFLLGRVNNGGAQIQDDFFRTRTSSYSFYVQDDWKVTPRLALNLGLRYQLDLAWKEKFDRAASFNTATLEWDLLGVNAPRTGFDNDFNNFGPRFGFAWNPRKNFVVRGGYGMLYPGNTTRGRGGDLNPSPLLLIPTNFTPTDGVVLHALPPINTKIDNPEAVLEASKPFSQTAQRRQRQQYVQQWNLTLENQFFEDTLFSISYAGSKGTKLPNNFFYNIFQLTEEQVRRGDFGDGPLGPAGNGQIGWVFPLFSADANSNYHSMQVKVDKRFSNGFSFLGSYTFSKLIDDASSDWGTFGGLDVQGQDYFNRGADRSVSAGDVPHRLVFSYIYELPVGRGKPRLNSGVASQLLGGWQLSGITFLQGGFPFGVVDDCFGFCNAARAWATRPFITGKTDLPEDQRTLERYINVGAYDFSNSFNYDTKRPFGNAPRYDAHARGPGLVNFDFALIKSTPLAVLGEEGRFEFRAEFFNLMNTPHFDMPRAGSFDSKFGAITATRLPNREIQFGLKLHF